MRNWSLVLCAFALTVACGDPDPVDDVDSGVRVDASTMTDASTSDDDASTTEDASTSDDDAGMTDDDAGMMTDAGSDAGGEEAATFAQVYAIITANCMPCHTGGNDSGGLRFGATAMSAYNALVGVDRMTGRGACTADEAPTVRVTPGEAEESFMYIKVSGDPPAGCGDQMPEDRPALSAAEIETIRSWIDGGALPPT